MGSGTSRGRGGTTSTEGSWQTQVKKLPAQDTYGSRARAQEPGLARNKIALSDSDEDEDIEAERAGRIGRVRQFFEQTEGSKRKIPDKEVGQLLDEVAQSSARYGFDRHVQECMSSLGLDNLADSEEVESTLNLPRSSLRGASGR